MSLTGPPEAPKDVLLIARVSEEAILTWRGSLTGGFVQTFKIVLRNMVSDEKKMFLTQAIMPLYPVIF